MPVENNSPSPWIGGFRTIGSALAQYPRLQAIGQRNAAMADYYRSRSEEQQFAGQEAQARARKTTAEAEELETGNLTQRKLSDAWKRLTANPNDTDAQADIISGFGEAYRKNPEATAKSLGQLFAQFQARTGGTNFNQMAALQGNAASIANKQAELAANPNMVVAPGAAVIPRNMQPGDQPVFQNPSAAGAREAYETTVTEIPARDAVAPVAPVHHWIGADTPGIPGSPAQPKQTITRRVPISLTDALNMRTQPTPPAPVAPPMAQPAPNAPALPAGGKVRVQHPNGSFGYIPAEQLQDALAQNYKLAPQQ